MDITSWKTTARWSTATILIVGAVYLAKNQGFVGLIAALPMSAIAAGLLFREAVRPFTWFIDWVFGTGPGNGKRSLNLNIARRYQELDRLEEALDEFQAVLKDHPDVAEAYREAMILAAQLDGDRKEVERLFRRAQRYISDEVDLEHVRLAYGEALEVVSRWHSA